MHLLKSKLNVTQHYQMTYLMAARVPARWGLAALFCAAVPVVVLATAAFLRLGWRAYHL